MTNNDQAFTPGDNDTPAHAAELRRRAEELLEERHTKEAPPRTEPDAQRLVHELQVHQIELELQNDELRRVTDDASAWLELYSDLYDFAPVGYFTLSLGGVIRQVNLAGAQLLEVDRSRLLNARLGFFVSPETLPAFNALLEKTSDSREKESCEVVLQTQAGTEVHARMDAVVSKDGSEYRIAVLDITERKRMEAELTWLASFPELNPLPVVEVDLEGNVYYVNPASLKLSPDLQERGPDHPWIEGLESALSSFREGRTTQSIRNVEVDGVCYEQTMHYVRDAQRVRIYCTDITERVELERAKQELFEREHRIADMLQEALVPTEVPHLTGGLSFVARYRPALREAQVGGDFYDVFELADNKIGFLIGDVAGKGLHAAMHVAAARHTIRSYAYLDASPAKVMELANEALRQGTSEVENVLTAFFAVVDTSKGTMTYVSAGHEPPVVCNAQSDIEELAVTGPMLGMIPGAVYSEMTYTLNAGDTVVMFTDGITEARHDGSILFEKSGVIEHLRKTCNADPEEIADALLNAAAAHAGGDLQDDAAIVVLRVPSDGWSKDG